MRLRSYLILVGLLGLWACASQKPPSGGPKDKDPPVVVSSIPTQESVNFSGKQIRLNFNEHVNIKNLRQELIITPHPDLDYKERIKAKSLIINILDSLKTNTTYTFYFGQSVMDVTESNKPENLTLAFSTGSYLDSGTVVGRVFDGLTGKAAGNNAIIGLYPPRIDTLSDPTRERPSYIGKCDQNGSFELKNLPMESFRIFAINDGNQNFKLEDGSEQIAIAKEFINISGQSDSLILILYSYRSTKPRILRMLSTTDHSKISFSAGILDFTMKPKFPFTWKNQGKDLYIFAEPKDSIDVAFSLTDSLGNHSDTTIYLKRDTSRTGFAEELKFTFNPKPGSALNRGDSIYLYFNVPTSFSGNDTVLFIQDGDSSTFLSSSLVKEIGNQEYIIHPEAEGRPFSIKFPKGAFLDYRGDSSKVNMIKYTYKNQEDYGQIEGEVITKEPCFVLQLLDQRFELVKAITDKKFQFNGLKPGSYRLRALIDHNCNGIWDQGNIMENIEPEPYVHYQEEIQLKANWIQQDKIFSF